MKTSGSATEAGTKAFIQSAGLPPSAVSIATGLEGWSLSRLGFGCYRIDDDEPEHHRALEAAFKRGINVIDTSTNYGDGSSELLVGKAIAKAIQSGSVHREEIVVVSKVGYVQGQNLRIARDREDKGAPYPEMVKYMDGCWHCIHPQFIQDQLELSLSRLGLECLDILLLHNPEYYLSDAEKKGENGGDARRRFYDRIQTAFRCLEDLAKVGKIRFYGVSSNTFVAKSDDFEATSVSRMWEIAESIDPAHRFRAIQLPMNLYETGAAITRNSETSEGKVTPLEFSKQKGLTVLINRPLNAIRGNRLTRLAEFPTTKTLHTFSQLLQEVNTAEAQWREEFAPLVKVQSDSHRAADFFGWGATLANVLKLPYELEQWHYYKGSAIVPQVRYLFTELDRYFKAEGHDQKWNSWREIYATQLDRLLDGIEQRFREQADMRSQEIKKGLRQFLPTELGEKSLSQQALSILLNTPGVSTVLVGMRSLPYVQDACEALSFSPFSVPSPVYQFFNQGTVRD